MSKALVAHNIACEGIRVLEGKNVLFARSVDEYVDVIIKLIDDESLRFKMVAEARILVEKKYSYEIIGKSLSAYYERCIPPKN